MNESLKYPSCQCINMETPDERATPAQGNIKVGIVVKVLGNAINTVWEKGVIVDINAEGVLIDYSYPLGVYGVGDRKHLCDLEVSK